MANLTCSTRAAAHNTTQLSVRRSSSANSTSPDNSLTSLNWLQSIKVPDLYAEEVTPQFLAPISPSSSDVFSSTNESDKEPEREECSISLSPLRRCLMQIVEYRKNPYQYLNDPTKPPLSYTTLIFLAIQSSNKEKVMLGEIYQWIRENFKYYRVTESTWQNSVRHNLSLNDFFMKIPRSEYDAGKGSFWKINPEYEQILNTEGELHCFDQNHLKLHVARVKAKSRKRSQSTSNGHGNQRKISSRMRKRARSQCSPPTADPCYLPGDLDWISLLSSQRVNCKSCPDGHSCRPSFGSPVLGPPDLGHIGEPLICSPAMIPHGLATHVPDTPPSLPATITSSSISLEELVTTSDSSPLLPPWNRSRDHSPISLDHPWAESRDSITQHLQTLGRSKGHHWSPEGTWSMATTTIHGISPTPPYHPKLHC